VDDAQEFEQLRRRYSDPTTKTQGWKLAALDRFVDR
jgi:hypothetical protein